MQLQLLEYNFGCETQQSGELFKFMFTFLFFSFFLNDTESESSLGLQCESIAVLGFLIDFVTIFMGRDCKSLASQVAVSTELFNNLCYCLYWTYIHLLFKS